MKKNPVGPEPEPGYWIVIWKENGYSASNRSTLDDAIELYNKCIVDYYHEPDVTKIEICQQYKRYLPIDPSQYKI